MTDYKRTKEYHAAMLAHALAELSTGREKRQVMDSLMAAFACSKSTAHRVATKAEAVQRGDRDPNHWGGKRDGAGRPHKPHDPSPTSNE